MFSFRGTGAPGMEDVLTRLPRPYIVIELTGARIVVGPSGAFVVGTATNREDVQDVADQLVRRAVGLRSALAERMAWVPFIDVLVVADDRDASALAATVVPLDLLEQTIVQGRPCLSEDTAERLAAVIEELRVIELAPPALQAADEKMAGCDGSPHPAASSSPFTSWPVSRPLPMSNGPGPDPRRYSSMPTGSTAAPSRRSRPD